MTACLMLDVDGVLVAGRPSDGKPWTTDLERDLGLSAQELGRRFFAESWKQVIIGQRDLEDALQACLDTMEADVSAQTLIAYWLDNDAGLVASVLDDCRDAKQRGVPIYLTTNQEHLRAAYLMDNLGLAAEVDGIIYSAQLGVEKPDPSFFDGARMLTGRQAGEHLLVDDIEANVAAARKAGWRAVHWTSGSRLMDILENQGFF